MRRAYFFAAAGEAMRRILVENARRKLRLKRGGRQERLDIDLMELAAPMPDDQLLALDDALDRLAEREPVAAKVVDLRFFVGLSQEQAARDRGRKECHRADHLEAAGQHPPKDGCRQRRGTRPRGHALGAATTALNRRILPNCQIINYRGDHFYARLRVSPWGNEVAYRICPMRCI